MEQMEHLIHTEFTQQMYWALNLMKRDLGWDSSYTNLQLGLGLVNSFITHFPHLEPQYKIWI